MRYQVIDLRYAITFNNLGERSITINPYKYLLTKSLHLLLNMNHTAGWILNSEMTTEQIHLIRLVSFTVNE